MKSSRDFDRIIRAATDDDLKRSRADQVVLVVDLVDRKVVEPRFWSLFTRRYERFVVTNAHAPGAVVEDVELLVPLTDYEGDDGLVQLNIVYQARCSPGDEPRLAASLAGISDPRKLVQDRLRFWVGELIEDRSAFIDAYEGRADWLRRELEERARREFGLSLNVEIHLEGRERVTPIKIGPNEIAISLRGHSSKLTLRLELTLPAPARLIGKAVQSLARFDTFEEAVIAEVQRFFEAEVTLHEFYYELEARVTADLRVRLDALVARWGREVGQLHVESASPLLEVSEVYESDVEVERDLPEYPEKVSVKTRFRMTLSDVGLYIEQGSPPLAAWTKEAVGQAAREVLFSTRYSQLVRDVEAKKAEIKRRTVEKARAIGYDIEQFVALTNLPLDELREPFMIAAEKRFFTKVSGVLAGLAVRVMARIVDTTRVEDFLDRRVDVKAAMRQAVHEYLTEVLHDVDPEEFYIYFDAPWPARAEVDDNDRAKQWEETLAHRIRRGIDRLLRDRFGAEAAQILFKVTDTEITDLLRELRRRSRRFQVEVEPRGGNLPPITLNLVLAVKYVDPGGWNNFLTKRPDMELLIQTARNVVENKLGEVTSQELDALRADQLMSHVNRWAAQRIGDDFGLIVEVTDLGRRRAQEESLRHGLDDKAREALDVLRALALKQLGARLYGGDRALEGRAAPRLPDTIPLLGEDEQWSEPMPGTTTPEGAMIRSESERDEARSAIKTYVVFPQAGLAMLASAPQVMSRAHRVQLCREEFAAGVEGIVRRLGERSAVDLHDQHDERSVLMFDGLGGGPQVYVTPLPAAGVLIVRGPAEVLELMTADPDVETLIDTEELVVELPPPLESGGEPAPTEWHLAAVGAHEAHLAGITGSKVWIGFADSGIQANHPEFAGHTLQRDLLCAEFDDVGIKVTEAPGDVNGHGTHVAAIAAGQKVGVAPGASIAMARVFPANGRAKAPRVLAGIDWLATVERPDGEVGVDLMCLSLCSTSVGRAMYSNAYKAVIQRIRSLGINVFAAIGNSGAGSHGSPGNYAETIGIGAIDRDGNLWPGSCGGAVVEEGGILKPDFVAPGVSIYSAVKDGGYKTKTGTSMAAPAAAGVAALILEQRGKGVDLRKELQGRARLTECRINGESLLRTSF